MAFTSEIIAASWLILVIAWAVSAGGAKRTVGRPGLRRGAAMWRLGVLILILLALRLGGLRHGLGHAPFHAVNASLPLGATGAVMCALGVGLALFARYHLGRNWGMPMSRKEDPELVTSGPYAIVRHPIYTGLILAMLGSAIGQGFFWLLPLVLWGAYFIYSARREEKLMIEQFPQAYPAYMKRTKMLLPFVL